jgi:hypothetical protein
LAAPTNPMRTPILGIIHTDGRLTNSVLQKI